MEKVEKFQASRAMYEANNTGGFIRISPSVKFATKDEKISYIADQVWTRYKSEIKAMSMT